MEHNNGLSCGVLRWGIRLFRKLAKKFEIGKNSGDCHGEGNADPVIPSVAILCHSLFSMGEGPVEIADVPIMPPREHFIHASKYFDDDLKYANRLPDRQADKVYSEASPGFYSPDFHWSSDVVSEIYIHEGGRWRRRKDCSLVSAPPPRTRLRERGMALVDKYVFGFNMVNGERI